MLRLLVTLLCSCGLLFATTTAYLNQDIVTSQFSLYKGTKVEVVDISKEPLQVKVKVYISKDKDIFFDKNNQLKIGEIKAEKVSEGLKELDFKLPKNHMGFDASSVWMEYEELYYEACTQCHAENNPHEHTMLEWEGIFEAMQEQSQLDEGVGEKVLMYLKSHAKDGFVAE